MTPALVNLMNMEHNPDLMLYATRTLTHMIEALPVTCSVVVSCQAVPTLCSKLLTIEYIDLAEQSLTALEKLSVDYGYVHISCVVRGKECLNRGYPMLREFARPNQCVSNHFRRGNIE